MDNEKGLPIEARITVCMFKERKEPHLHCFYLQKTGTPSSTGAN
ncbi:MAG: hypothetical protein Q4C88_03125 [Akkermansia sp.]|nr:hypothetical protein [Akkermansia sp.]